MTKKSTQITMEIKGHPVLEQCCKIFDGLFFHDFLQLMSVESAAKSQKLINQKLCHAILCLS